MKPQIHHSNVSLLMIDALSCADFGSEWALFCYIYIDGGKNQIAFENIGLFAVRDWPCKVEEVLLITSKCGPCHEMILECYYVLHFVSEFE